MIRKGRLASKVGASILASGVWIGAGGTSWANCISITSPAAGSTVSGSSVAIHTADSCKGVWWEALKVDGNPAGGFVTGQVVLNTTRFANGSHTIAVTSQSKNPGSVVLGKASETLVISSGSVATPSATPTSNLPGPTPTVTATQTPTATATPKSNSSAGATPTPTRTATATPTRTATATSSSTRTPSPSSSPTKTASVAYQNYTLSSPQVFDCGGGKVKSVTISASGVTVQNCEITSQQNGQFGYGILLTGSGISNITIQNNNIHDLCQDGIYMDWMIGNNIVVSNNTITTASMSGINISGTGATVVGNDISNTQQYPDRSTNSIFAGCQEAGGADADAIRFFGTNHVIKNNYLHDIQWGTTVNPDPHVDCFQTWGAYDPGENAATGNILITGNHCVWPSTSSNIDNEISSIEALNGSSTSGITYSYNVFSDMRNGIVIGSGVGPMIFEHNTVDHIIQEASLQYPGSISSAAAITNNIFYDCGSGGDSFATGSGFTVGNDDCVLRDGSDCGTYPSNYSHLSVDPTFVSSGSGSTPWLNADYHLQSSSTVQSMGACGTDVTVACPPPQ